MRQKNPANILKGAKARSEGNAFEFYLMKAARLAGIRVVPFPMGARPVSTRFGRPKLVPVRTPFDMIFSRPGAKSAFIDSKSISDDTLVYSFLTPHQVDVLADLESDGHKAGYIVHFKKTGRVIFFAASKLQALERLRSYSQDDGEDLGTLFSLNLGGFL